MKYAVGVGQTKISHLGDYVCRTSQSVRYYSPTATLFDITIREGTYMDPKSKSRLPTSGGLFV